jgi:hypothetical protein
MSRVDSLVLPLVFVGLHVVLYAMMTSQAGRTDSCLAAAKAIVSEETGPEEQDFVRIVQCTRAIETKSRVITYLSIAALVVGALWIFRQLDGRAISIGVAGLIIPALFFVGELLSACSGDACDAADLLNVAVAGPAFWGTVAYTVLQLTHRL